MTMKLADGALARTSLLASLQLLVLLGTAALGQPDGLTAERRLADSQQKLERQLASPALTDRQRAAATVQLTRTLTDRALAASAAGRESLWRQAQQVAQDFLSKSPASPQALLVRLQAAASLVAQGEALLHEAQIAPAGESAWDASRSVLRTAIGQLVALERALGIVLRERAYAAQSDSQLSERELLSLETNSRWQLARALHKQALCYPAESPDRINAATQAVEAMARIGQLQPGDPLAWQVQLDEIACNRLAGRRRAARLKLEVLSRQKLPAEIAQRALAERIILQLADGKLVEAAQLAQRIGNATSPELQFARLEALATAARSAGERGEQRQATDLRQSAVTLAQHIQQSHPDSYWARRAGMMVVEAATDAPQLFGAQGLLLASDDLFRAGRMNEALAAYDRARESAAAGGDSDAAFVAGLRAATIEHERKAYHKAVERYRSLALEMREHPKAAEAHLMAAFDQAQLLRKHKSPDVDAYLELLNEHLATWPDGPTSAQAAHWLGGVKESQAAWRDAITAYKKVDRASPRIADAVAAIVRCYAGLLSAMPSGAARQQAAEEAIAQFEKMFAYAGGALLTQWDPAARAAVLAACTLWMTEVPHGYMRVADLATQALGHSPSAPQQWKDSMGLLGVAALARQGRVKEAATALDGVHRAGADQILLALNQIASALETATPDRRRPLLDLELRVAALAPAGGRWPSATRLHIERARATALAQTGKPGEAVAILKELVREFPNSGQLREQLATTLGSQGDEETRKAALEIWLELASRSKPGSARWFRACYAVAETQLALGRKAHARRTISLTRTTYPDLGGPVMKARFLALQAQSEK